MSRQIERGIIAGIAEIAAINDQIAKAQAVADTLPGLHESRRQMVEVVLNDLKASDLYSPGNTGFEMRMLRFLNEMRLAANEAANEAANNT